MWICIIWSITYDNIFEADFDIKQNLEKSLFEWNINSSMSFLSMERLPWWNWLNIAYNLALLWEKAILLWAVWFDYEFSEYIRENVNLNYIHKSRNGLSAVSSIMKDSFWNQINTFFPWVGDKVNLVKFDSITESIKYALIWATNKDFILYSLEEFKKRWIKTFFDPGHITWDLDKEFIKKAESLATYLILSKHNFSLYKKITEQKAEEIIPKYEKVIITFWKDWSKIMDKNSLIEVEAVENETVIDDTWVGDAFRAGLLKWLYMWYSWEKSARIWSLLASFLLSSKSWQQHFIDKKQFELWYTWEFKDFLKL